MGGEEAYLDVSRGSFWFEATANNVDIHLSRFLSEAYSSGLLRGGVVVLEVTSRGIRMTSRILLKGGVLFISTYRCARARIGWPKGAQDA